MTIYDKTQDEKIQFPVGIGIIQTEPVRNFYNTSDATATPSDIIVGKTTYSRYGMINGELDLQNEKETSYQEGYSEGNENGYNTGYSIGEQEGYGRGWIEGNNLGYEYGYNTGTENGKTLGREEIISEQSDANITPNDVLEGKIGYGKNNEKIVGTNVGGFDFSTIGYTPEENQATNAYYVNALKYSQELYDEWDPNTTNATSKFLNDKNLIYAPAINTSNVTRMSRIFEGCSSLIRVPLLNTANVILMGSMFAYCDALTTIPQFDTRNVTSTQYMFQGCSSLTNVPLFNTINVTDMIYMFDGCSSLTTIPQFDTRNVEDMERFVSNCKSLTTIPLLKCDNVIKVTYFGGFYSTINNVKNLGGFENLGMRPTLSGTTSYFLQSMPNLTKESLLNVLNGLYDRASAGYSTLTLTLHNNHKALLSNDELAIATNKGWIIS